MIRPVTGWLTASATFWDALAYSIMLAVFSLVSWLSQRSTERSLKRALDAEELLRTQNRTVTRELKQETATLRRTRIEQTRQLYQFAIIGQSSTATLHELSNQLSILSLDLDDIGQQDETNKAVTRAHKTIENINKTVRQARYQLNQDLPSDYAVRQVIRSSVNDARERFTQHNIGLTYSESSSARRKAHGSPIALSQVMAILLSNAFDACENAKSSRVTVTIINRENTIIVRVIDSGPGVSEAQRRLIFKQGISSKPKGLGMGLFIAHHLAKTQLGAELRLEPKANDSGACFSITIPTIANE